MDTSVTGSSCDTVANSQEHHPGAINPSTFYVSVFIKQQFVLEISQQHRS